MKEGRGSLRDRTCRSRLASPPSKGRARGRSSCKFHFPPCGRRRRKPLRAFWGGGSRKRPRGMKRREAFREPKAKFSGRLRKGCRKAFARGRRGRFHCPGRRDWLREK